MVQANIGKHSIVLKDEERQECEIWSRVMGYYRPVSEYNIGKKSEHNERTFFIESKAANYAFDVTPRHLVTGLITERGICNANKESILKLFPEHKNG